MNLKKPGFYQQLVLILASIMLISFLVVSITTQISTRKNITDNAIRIQKESLEIKTALFDVYLKRINQLADNLYSNADVYSQIQIEEPNSTNSYRIHLFLSSLRSMSPGSEIFQIYLDNYSSGQSYVVSEKASSYGPSHYHIKIPPTVTQDEIYGEGPLLSSNYGYSINTSGTPIYSFHYRLFDYAHLRLLGTLSFDIEIAALEEYLFGSTPSTSVLQYLIQDSGEIIFTNSVPLTEQQLNRIIEDCSRNGYSPVDLPDFSGIAFAGTANLGNLNFHILQMMSNQDLYAEANRVFTRNIFIILLSYLAACLIMILLIKRTIQPLRELDAYVRDKEKHQFQGENTCQLSDYVTYDRDDEIGYLISHTEQTFLALEDSFQRQKKLNEAYRTAEAKMLQAQINPHFLYNSLQSIASLALQHQDKETFSYITKLGTMMQYSMNLDQITVELHQEFEHVQSYITLQNIRFVHALRYEAELSPEAASIPVPKMILQPLAGNVYKHGQVCRRADSYFRLKAGLMDNRLIITAENNGDPCSPEQVKELNQAFGGDTDKLSIPGDSGIGLRNVLHRLRILYGPEVFMEISSDEENGTRILLSIPLS